MRISDWSSYVCSSDLDSRRSKTEWNPFSAGKHVKFPDGFIAKAPLGHIDDALKGQIVGRLMDDAQIRQSIADFRPLVKAKTAQIGRASCRERVCQYG